MGHRTITRTTGAAVAAMLAASLAAPAAHAAPQPITPVTTGIPAVSAPVIGEVVKSSGAAVVHVSGMVQTPTDLTMPELIAASHSTVTIPGTRLRGTGVSLDGLLEPLLLVPTSGKNPAVRVTVSVAGPRQRVTFALAELEQGLGNHDATILTSIAGRHLPRPVLVVSGDRGLLRTVIDVHTITVTIHDAPATPASVPVGSLMIRSGQRRVIITSAQLHRLPRQHLEVSYQSSKGVQHHSESGPQLSAVLHAAGIRATRDTWILGVGSDGYAAAVTPAESWVGGRTLLVSLTEDHQNLNQPRLIAAGDQKGGRDVSDLVQIDTGRG